MDSLGLPHDAPRYMVAEKMNWKDDYIDSLFDRADMSPRDKVVTSTKQMSDTMNSHRLGRWAHNCGKPGQSEEFWRATARRYFMGKDTEIRPIRLDSTELLVECAQVAGLDVDEARQVLKSDIYRDDILHEVEEMKRCGVRSIPVIVFEVEGVAHGSWPANAGGAGRAVYHGSGCREEFVEIFEQLHRTMLVQ